MGEAKRRRQQLGGLYGTAQGSPLICTPPVVAMLLSPLIVDGLEAHLTADQLLEVALLLRDGPTRWERRYRPLPEQSACFAEVVVRCDGEHSEVEYIPLSRELGRPEL